MANVETNQKRETWHLDKTINVSHVIAFLTLSASFFMWVNGIEKNVEKNTQAIEFLLTQQKEEKNKIETLRVEIRQDFKELNTL